MKQAGVLHYLFTDHLGSASVSYRADDGSIIGQRYHPWGEVKGYSTNQLPTDYTYTGQEDVGFTRAPNFNDPIRILDYGARYYWPEFGRFISPDTGDRCRSLAGAGESAEFESVFVCQQQCTTVYGSERLLHP